jgi:hypothetical protein
MRPNPQADFGARTWRAPLATFESVGEHRRRHWAAVMAVEARATEGGYGGGAGAVSEADLGLLQHCREHHPERGGRNAQSQRYRCGLALALALAAAERLPEAAAEYRRTAGLLPRPDGPEAADCCATVAKTAVMQIANFLNFYLVLLWRLGEHAVYDQEPKIHRVDPESRSTLRLL